MNRRKFLLNLNKIVYFFEMLISILLIVGIIISVPDIFRYYHAIILSPAEPSYELFKHFLDHVLLLVIAVEFVLLMVAHSDSTIIHLIMLVIARKMLIKSDTMNDIIIGVIAISLLFAVRKFLIGASDVGIFSSNDNVFSASTDIEEINRKCNFQIEDLGYNSIGGLVSDLIQEKGYDLELGTMVDDGKYIYEVIKSSNNVIESVSIHPINWK